MSRITGEDHLGEQVFKNVVVPVCISIISKSSPQPTLSFASLSSDTDLETDLNSVRFATVSLEEIHKTRDKSFYSPTNLKSGEHSADEILNLKDAGIQYHRSGIGLKNKGGNDLYERLFSPSPSKFKNSVPVWYGKLIESYYISSTTDEYFNLDYKDCLRASESASFTRLAFETAPKIVWRQTAPYIRATLDSDRRWFRNTIQCCWIKEDWKDKIDIEWILGVFNSSYYRYLYNKIVREAGRVFPQVKLTHIRKLPIRIPAKSIQNRVKKLVHELIAAVYKQRDSNGVHRSVEEIKKRLAEIDDIIFQVYEVSESEKNATKDFVAKNNIFL